MYNTDQLLAELLTALLGCSGVRCFGINCSSVVLWFEKGDYCENVPVVFCPNKQHSSCCVLS